MMVAVPRLIGFFLILAMVPTHLYAATAEVVVVASGPYELIGSHHVIGFIIERNGQKVKFKPCSPDDPIEVTMSELTYNAEGCKGEAPYGPPITVACSNLPSGWGEMLAIKESNTGWDKVGAMYRFSAEGKLKNVEAQGHGTDMVSAALGFQLCGRNLMAVNTQGEPSALVVPIPPPDRYLTTPQDKLDASKFWAQ